jgi:hypothetical protein
VLADPDCNGLLSEIIPHVREHAAGILDRAEDGYADLLFAIVGSAADSNGSTHINIRSTHGSEVIGFEIVLGAGWAPCSIDIGDGKSLKTFQGIMTYSRVGVENDRFASILLELYGVEASVLEMKPQIQFTALSLEGHPMELGRGVAKMKLFYEAEDMLNSSRILTLQTA